MQNLKLYVKISTNNIKVNMSS